MSVGHGRYCNSGSNIIRRSVWESNPSTTPRQGACSTLRITDRVRRYYINDLKTVSSKRFIPLNAGIFGSTRTTRDSRTARPFHSRSGTWNEWISCIWHNPRPEKTLVLLLFWSKAYEFDDALLDASNIKHLETMCFCILAMNLQK